MKGVLVRGIDPALEPEVTDLGTAMQAPVLSRLTAGSFGIVLGVELARSLDVREGDSVTLIAPSGQVTPAGFAASGRCCTHLSSGRAQWCSG